MTGKNNDFDKVAPSWDLEPRRVKLAGEVGAAIAQAVALNDTMEVLDFGCGTGLLTLYLRPFVHSVTGVDSSEGMIAMLNNKVADEKLANVHAICLDLARGDRLEKQFSLIVSSMAFHHIKDVGPLIEYFYKLLTPAGKLCIADLDLDGGLFHGSGDGVYHNGFDRETLRSMFSRAGFTGMKDMTASVITKDIDVGEKREFSVFLLVGAKDEDM